MIAPFVALQPIVEQVFLVSLLSAVLLALLVTFAAPLVASSLVAVVPFSCSGNLVQRIQLFVL